MATLTQTTPHVPPRSGSTPAVGHLAPQPSTSPPQSAAATEQAAFAFARIHNEICLVQTDASFANPKTPLFLAPVDVTVFRHEFGTMFRFARRATLPACDVQVLAALDEAGMLCDDEAGVVFLSREMTDQLLQYTAPRRMGASSRPLRRY